jgi:hypothetical protein
LVLYPQVILQVKPIGGKEKIIRARVGNKFALCDNEWHRIRIRVGVSRLSLQFNSLPEVAENLGSSLNLGGLDVKPTIYIGGNMHNQAKTVNMLNLH